VPASYTVVEAEKTADKPDRGYGPMQTIRLKLRNEQGNERDGISWYAKATTPLPAAGSQVFGDVTKTDYGWQFKKARTGPVSGSSRDFRADPVKQAAIACESAQKAAVEIVRMWLDQGNGPGIGLDELTTYVKHHADLLYQQIQKAMSEAEK
jgi:hypothetical protein